TWLDPTAPTGWIEFFNRGAETVYVAVGGPGVTADISSAACAPGARIRLTRLDPDVDTHVAVLAASNSSEINARTEIGLTEYLANAFQQTGGAQLENIELRNCLFRDLGSAAKSLRPEQFAVVMDCDFDRIYQDIIALSPPPGGSLYILRNVESLPFSRAGIAEDLDGDARDPHGDQFQMFSDGSATVGPVFYAGNRIRFTSRRPGSKSQGIFVSDNDFDPSYSDLYFISTMQVGGSGRALSLGEENTSFKVRDAFVYGATIFDSADINSDLPFVLIDHDDDGTVYVGKSIASSYRASDADLQLDDNVLLSDAADRNAVFPNLGNFVGGIDRSALEAALATGAEGEGRGAVATANALDWITRDHTAVIRWENLPSGAHWNRLTNQPLDSEIVLPLRKIMNLRPAQRVIAGSGTEWRSVDTDGVTEIQSWTGIDGTIEPGQFVQVRATSSPSPGGSVTASIMINGFEQSLEIVSSAAPTVFLEQGDPIGYFQDPSDVPAGTSRISSRGKFRFAAEIPNGAKPFAQVSTGCDLFTRTDGSLNATIEDGTGAKMMTNLPVAPIGSLLPDTWHEIEFDVDQTAGEVRLTIDGVTTVTAFMASGNGVFQSNRSLLFIAGSNGNTPLPAGTRFADLSVDLNGVLYKTISNDATTANGDAWHLGGAF
ncbi:MAG: hypothetical protein V2I43_06180, partial [Parvularcula sp.]|nr:hypothetical protein [Parvularcula sp.]